MDGRALFVRASIAPMLGVIVFIACGKVDGPTCRPKSLPGSAVAPPDGAFRLESATLGVQVTGVNYYDNSAAKTIGFDLDGKCTSADSTDVCTPPPGPPGEQADGVAGIDNAFGISVAEMGFDVGDDFWSSATLTLVTRSGSGELDVENQYTSFAIPLLGAKLVENPGGSGTLVARIPAQGLVDSLSLDGAGLPSLCRGDSLFAIGVQIRAASDLLLDGSNTRGQTCDAISIGVSFSQLTTVSAPQLAPGRCTIATDGGADE